MNNRVRIQLLLTIAALAVATEASAQPQAPDFSAVEIKTTRLADDFYTLEGRGGTVSVLTGPDGVLLVDSQFAPLTDKLVAAIRKISDKPIRFLVDTHLHGDHTGGNENFAQRGVLVFGRDQLRTRLEHPNPAPDGTPRKPAVAMALPVVTYDGPVSIHVNGEDVRLIPVRNAHTDGDTLISFPGHDIIATGDCYRGIGYLYVDLSSGGSLAGELDALGTIIGLAGPHTKIIPGHGPITDRNGVIAERDRVLTVRDKIAALIAQGKTLDEVIAAKPTSEFDAQVLQGAQSADEIVKWMYTALEAH
jgi:glyoxylase-like metal-dependent hydrolase (beta-lactamase superfamily II)